MKPYTPKPIRGQSYAGYTKVSVAQVKKLFATNQSFVGFIVGNKVHSFHFFGGWGLAFPIKKQSFQEFEDTLQRWAWYNANSETGNTPAIFLKNRQRVAGVIPQSLPLLIGA